VPGRIGRVPDASRSASEALYPATVMLAQPFVTGAGRTHALEPGMVFEATILQERRVLWRWIFEPLAAYFDQP
jgi:membrane fusion protein